MRNPQLNPGCLLTVLLLAPLACAAVAQTPAAASVADRVATQNKLFDEYYETGLRENPERATAVGDYRYNDRLADESLAGIARRHAMQVTFEGRLAAIPVSGMSEQAALSHRLLQRSFERADEEYALKNYEMSVNQQNGIHTGLADLPLSMPFDSVKHYEDYVERLHDIPVALTQTTEVLLAREHDGLMPPKFLIELLPGQCEGIIAANPFVLPLKKFPASSAMPTSSG